MNVTLITARLRFDTPGGVAGTEAREQPDGSVLPLRTLPDGETVHIPGSSVAGNLRAHCTASGLADLFGDTPEVLKAKKNRKNTEPAVPSSIQVLGTAFPKRPDTVNHTRNASDRFRGAARTHYIHRVEMLTPGTTFDVVLRWDDADPERREEFLRALQSWRPMLGRGVSYGAGRCSLVAWELTEYDLSTENGLLAWLRDGAEDPCPEPTRRLPEFGLDDSDLLIDARLSIVDAIHCGTDRDPEASSGNSLRMYGYGGKHVVPGSTLKGVLRSRAEYICRVLDVDACRDQACGQCRPCRLFGFAGRPREKAGPPRAQRSRITVEDAVILAEGEPATKSVRPHVAIDRFTGGAQDEALFEHDVIERGSFALRVRRLPPVEADPEEERRDLMLLHAVLKDLDDGYIGIGARTTAGFGTVRVESGIPDDFDISALAGALRSAEPAATANGSEA